MNHQAVIAVVSVLLLGGCKEDPQIVANHDLTKPDAPAAVVPPTPEESPTDKLLKLPTLESAIAATKPFMDDQKDESSKGTLQLAAWSMKNMKWSDVFVAKNETSQALIKKDADEERGKRMCVGGTIVQIAVEKTQFGKMSVGLMYDNSMSLYHFMAVGSTGELVEKSSARICGVVTGRYSYSNSAGGTGHAVDVVGMFDLPANKATNPAAAK